jgi:subtilisin family serine protease
MKRLCLALVALLFTLQVFAASPPDPVADCRDLTNTNLTNILTKPYTPVMSPQTIDCPRVDPQGNGACRDNWGLDRIDQAAPRGATSQYLFGRTGAGVYVYVVDSGVTDSHDEFRDMRNPNGSTSRVLPGFNTANNTTDTSDCLPHGHGTHVASIIAGNSSGVAKNAWIVPVRYLGAQAPGQECPDPGNTPVALEAAFNWIIAHHQSHPGPAVVNLSSDDTDWRSHPTLRKAVRSLLAAGITLIQAASNEDDLRGDACEWTFSHPEIPRAGVVIVGGTEVDDTRWRNEAGSPDAHFCDTTAARPDCGSNTGPCVDLWAPAAQIVAASKRATNGFCRLSGTSMAAPHVTGVAALFLEGRPNVPPATVEAALTMAATRSALDASIGDSPNLLVSSNLPELAGAVAVDDHFSYAPGTPVRVLFEDLLANDFAWDGRPLQVLSVSPPAFGTLVEDALGFTYTPSPTHETESFSYEVISGGSSVASATITMTVAHPFAVDDHFTQFVGEDFNFTSSQLVANDVAEGGLGPAETADLAFAGFVRMPTTGILSEVPGDPGHWSFHPTASFTGRDSATYQARNPAGLTSEGTVFFSSYTSDHHGFGVDSLPDLRWTVQGQPTTFDPLGNDKVKKMNIELVADHTSPHHGTVSVDIASSMVTYQPDPGFAGFDSFTYLFRTFDTQSHEFRDLGAESVLVEVQPNPPGPVARPDSYQAQRNTPLAIGYTGLLANDSGSGLTVLTDQFTTPAHGTLTICCSADGFTYTPATDYVGPDSFQYTIQDNAGRTSSATISINVDFTNHPPIAVNDTASTEHDTAITIQVLTNDSDPDGDALTVTGVIQPTDGSGTAAVNSNGTITFTPTAGFSTGPIDSVFQYTIKDSHNAAAAVPASVTVHVRGVNHPPTPQPNSFSTPRNTPLDFTYAQLLANDTDSDGDPLSVVSVSGVPCSGGVCHYVPPAGFVGNAGPFTYTVTDNRPNGTASSTITITVYNRAPVAVNDVASTPPNTPVTINVRTNDSDPDGDPITVNAITAQAAAGTGTCAVASGGTGVVYTPPAGFMTQTTCSYTVTDGLATSAPATITLYINRPPIARGDQVRVPFATQIQIARATLLVNDFDPDGDTLTISSFDTTGMNGTLSCPTGGTACTYTPPGGYYTAVTSFKYTVTDGKNGFSTATVKLKVGVVQSVPVANDDLLTTTLNTPKAFTVLDVLANDTDADGDVLTAWIGSGPRDYGSVSCNTFNCTYTPNTGFVGSDRFSYTASDGSDGSATASIKMMVLPPSTPTFDAQEDQISTAQNSSRFFTRSFLTSNDYSPTGDPLTVTSFDTTGLNGTLDCTSDTFGCIYYPPSYFVGTARFKYTVSDTHGHSDTVIVKINVGATNTAPVAANDSLTTRANTPLTFSVFELLKNDVDAQNDPMTVTVYPYPSHGTLTCSTPNYWCTYTPAAGYTGTDSFNYMVSDGIAYSNQATVTVTVQPVLAKDAVIVSQSVPASMTMGQTYPVSLTIKNIGTVAWSLVGPQCNAFRLGAVNPYDNTTWGASRAELPSTVAANGQVTVTFNVTAPTAPGPYNFQRRMVHECVEWFGDLSPNVTVSVHP